MKTMKIEKTFYQVIAEYRDLFGFVEETHLFHTKREAKKYIRKLKKSGVKITDLALRTTEFYKV